MRKLALLFALALVAALAPASAAMARTSAHASMIGGMTAAPGSWPSAAYLVALQGDQGYACTGTVVAPRVVLTAAHCASDLTAADYRVRTGTEDWADDSRGQVNKVERLATFTYWNAQSLFGDAAVLILDGPTSAPAMPLATLNDVALLRAKRSFSVAGFGQTFTGDPNPPSALRTGSLNLQAPSYCGHFAAELRYTFQPAGMLCAIDSRDFNAGLCHGDSGGALVAKRADGTLVQVGITSAAENFCSVHFPGYFARVDLVVNWANAWIAAAAAAGSGPVTPPATIPPASTATPPLGTLSAGEAASLVRRTIASKMGSRFSHAKHYRSSCKRQSDSAVQCKVSWSKQGKKYAGVVKAFLRYDRSTRLVVLASAAKFKSR